MVLRVHVGNGSRKGRPDRPGAGSSDAAKSQRSQIHPSPIGMAKIGGAACLLACLLGLLCGCRNATTPGARGRAGDRAEAQSRRAGAVDESGLLFRMRAAATGRAELWVMGRDGSHRRRITDAKVRGAWSRDGKSIIYMNADAITVADLRGDPSVSLSMKGRRISALGQLPQANRFCVVWVQGTVPSQRQGLSVVDVATGHVEDLVEWGLSSAPADVLLSLSISSRGHWAIVALGYSGIVMVGLTGREKGKLYSRLPNPDVAFWRTAWPSPDDSFWLACVRSDSMEEVARVDGMPLSVELLSLWMLRNGSAEPQRIYGPVGTMDKALAWHPFLLKLAFATFDMKRNESRLWFATRVGNDWRVSRVAQVPGCASAGGWSSDGAVFAYTVVTSREHSRIYVCDADGSNPRPISPPDANDAVVASRPRAVEGSGE
jgi:hypothetical protein